MKKLIFSVSVVTLFVLGVLVVIVFNSSPLDQESAVVPMFFTFSFLSIALVTFLVSLVSIIIKFPNPTKRLIVKWLRRSVEFSIVAIGLLAMAAFGVLNILSAITFSLAIILVDLFVESKESYKERYE